MLLNVILLNLIFAMFMSSISSGLNIMNQVFNQKGYTYLGNCCILFIFFFGMLGNFTCIIMTNIGVLYIEKLGYRLSFFFHSLGYLLFLVVGVYVCFCFEDDNANTAQCSPYLIWPISILFSSLSGFSSSGLFVTQNSYI